MIENYNRKMCYFESCINSSLIWHRSNQILLICAIFFNLQKVKVLECLSSSLLMPVHFNNHYVFTWQQSMGTTQGGLTGALVVVHAVTGRSSEQGTALIRYPCMVGATVLRSEQPKKSCIATQSTVQVREIYLWRNYYIVCQSCL